MQQQGNLIITRLTIWTHEDISPVNRYLCAILQIHLIHSTLLARELFVISSVQKPRPVQHIPSVTRLIDKSNSFKSTCYLHRIFPLTPQIHLSAWLIFNPHGENMSMPLKCMNNETKPTRDISMYTVIYGQLNSATAHFTP